MLSKFSCSGINVPRFPRQGGVSNVFLIIVYQPRDFSFKLWFWR